MGLKAAQMLLRAIIPKRGVGLFVTLQGRTCGLYQKVAGSKPVVGRVISLSKALNP